MPPVGIELATLRSQLPAEPLRPIVLYVLKQNYLKKKLFVVINLRLIKNGT